MEQIIIVGASGHAKVVADAVERQGRYRIIGFLDYTRSPGEPFLGYPILGREEDVPHLLHGQALAGAVVAIGDNFQRADVVRKLQNLVPNLPFVCVVHPSATIGRDVAVGPGTVVMAGVVVNPCCKVGAHCILNTRSALDHDSVLEDFSSLAPGVTTGGNVRIGAYTAIGIGATLIQRVTIGAHTVIGAGSVVVRDMGPGQVAYGVPARKVRGRAPNESYL